EAPERGDSANARRADLGRVELAAGVVAVPPAPAGGRERAGPAGPLRDRAGFPFRQYARSRGEPRPSRLHSRPAPAPARRLASLSLGSLGHGQAQPDHAPDGVAYRREPEDPGSVLRRGASVPPARDPTRH